MVRRECHAVVSDCRGGDIARGQALGRTANTGKLRGGSGLSKGADYGKEFSFGVNNEALLTGNCRLWRLRQRGSIIGM